MRGLRNILVQCLLQDQASHTPEDCGRWCNSVVPCFKEQLEKLCAYRRSAGLPYLVQGLASSGKHINAI